MKRMGFCLSLIALSSCAIRADITLTCDRAILRLSDNAVPLSLLLTADGTECLNRFYREPLAEVQTSDRVWHPAVSVRQTRHALVLGFRDTDTTLTLAVETPPDWITLRVAAFGCTRPAAVRFVKLNSAFTETVGKRLNIGWNNAYALCVMAAAPLTDAQVMGKTLVTREETVASINRGEGGVNPRVCLTAMVEGAPGHRMEGAAAVIIACPTRDFKKVARSVSHAYGLLTNETADGTPVKDTELVRGSSFILSAGLGDTDNVIQFCNKAGIRQVLLNSDALWSDAERCTLNVRNFPNGITDLGAFVARLKAAGITTGMQCPQQSRSGASLAAQLAEVYNTCGFGMVYFDGGSKADNQSGSNVTQFQDRAMRLINRPVIHLGDTMTHPLWHSFSRLSASDTALRAPGGATRAGQPPEKWPNLKARTDASVAWLLSQRGDMMPCELGPVGVWQRQTRDGRVIEGPQLDEIEYLLCRSLAYDCPVSLQTSFSELNRHPLTPQILRLVKAYETARLARRFTEADTAPLREQGKDFTLLQRRGFPPVLVPVHPVACGNSRDTHAMVGAFERGSIATFWHAVSSANVTLDLSPFVMRVADFDDQRVIAQKNAAGQLVLPVTTQRLTLFCPNISAAVLEQKIKNSLSTKTP